VEAVAALAAAVLAAAAAAAFTDAEADLLPYPEFVFEDPDAFRPDLRLAVVCLLPAAAFDELE